MTGSTELSSSTHSLPKVLKGSTVTLQYVDMLGTPTHSIVRTVFTKAGHKCGFQASAPQRNIFSSHPMLRSELHN